MEAIQIPISSDHSTPPVTPRPVPRGPGRSWWPWLVLVPVVLGLGWGVVAALSGQGQQRAEMEAARALLQQASDRVTRLEATVTRLEQTQTEQTRQIQALQGEKEALRGEVERKRAELERARAMQNALGRAAGSAALEEPAADAR